MLNKILYLKKGQISDTITWIVATTIIIVVVTISVFAINFIFSDENKVYLIDKNKDLIATKSITAFLDNGENSNLLRSKDYAKFQGNIYRLVGAMPSYDIFLPSQARDKLFAATGDMIVKGVWNFELIESDKIKINIVCREINSRGFAETLGLMKTNILLEDMQLNFNFVGYC